MNLYARFRNALTQLAVWSSEGGTINLDPTHGTGKPGHKILTDPHDEKAPPLEQTILVLQRRWQSCTLDAHRLEVVTDAEAEVARIRYPDPVDRQSETDDERKTRILTETEGFAPDEVALSRHGVTAREIRKWRKQVGRDTETGRAGPATRASSKDVKDQVIALWLERDRNRLTRNEIGRRVGVHHEVVKRIIGEWERSQRDVA